MKKTLSLFLFIICTLTVSGQLTSPGGGGGAPTGGAGGDLTGTYPNPGVGKINGTTVPSASSTALGNAPTTAGGFAALDANALLPLSAWGINLDSQSFVFDGDSIPGGNLLPSASTQSFPALFGQLPFAKNHGTTYNVAVNGSQISAGSNGGQTVVTSGTVSSGTTITLTTSPTPPLYTVMAVDPQHLISAIPYGTTGTVSGTTLTLSKSITGSITSGTSLVLGGNNMTDRFPSQVYPHRPLANGGDGGPRALLFVMCQLNEIIYAGNSAATIESHLSAYYALAQASGFTVVAIPTLPSLGSSAITSGQETTRETVNKVMRQGITTANYTTLPNYVVDLSDAVDMSDANTSTDGRHPYIQGHLALANRLNSAMIANGSVPSPAYGVVTEPLSAQQGITTTTVTASGAAALGATTITGNASVSGNLTAPTITGATTFNNPITVTNGVSVFSATTNPLTVKCTASNSTSAFQAADPSGNLYAYFGYGNASPYFPGQAFVLGGSGKDLALGSNLSATAQMTIKSGGNILVGSATDDGTNKFQVTGNAKFNNVVILKGYTVSTLPTGVTGAMAYVTDATAPTYNGTLTGSGTVTVPVFYNGSAWVAH